MDIRLLYIDLFCGAGGTSTGVEKATFLGEKCAKVVACVNHDANAIASHQANHPDTLHFTEDIRTFELSPLVKHLDKVKEKYPNAYVVLWASLECTNFSKAKGGMPRDADSRTLAEHLFRYIEALQPDYIQIENVEEFMCWGDLDKHGKPISKDKGRCYLKWVNNVKNYGYDYDYRILNAADYGAYTSRKRFFCQFAKCGLPIVFPEQTYAKNGDDGDTFHQCKKWNPVREVLDLNDEGTSIFTKKKPFCEKTLERIYAGLIKFVAKSTIHSRQFLANPYSFKSNGGAIEKPCCTLIAHMDKAPIWLVTAEHGEICIAIFEKDSPMTRKIKEFMAAYGIVDIKMRMLNIQELKRIMGFPEDYTLIGTQAEQKKFIGNAVEVNMSRSLCEALCMRLVQKRKAVLKNI